jgi:ribosomal protein S18 acetylase RimI-like enzyme
METIPGGDPQHALVHAAFLAPSPLEKYRPAPSRRSTHGAISLISDGDVGPDFNRVLVLGPTAPDRVFAVADPFFGGPLAYSLIVEAGATQAVEDELRARGWRLDEEEPALVLSPLPSVLPPAPPGLVIRPVVDAAGFDDFLGVSKTPSVFLPSVAAALDPAVALCVGYVDGLPVASSRLACLGPIAEITGVVVVPWARRHGYGTALTWAVIAAAQAQGCGSAVLTATALGYPVYRRMGFRPMGVYRTYLPPSPALEPARGGSAHMDETNHR